MMQSTPPQTDSEKYRINRKLALLILLQGFRQNEIAEKLGINRSHLNRILRADIDTSASTFLQILALLKIDVEAQMDERIMDLSKLKSLTPLGESKRDLKI